MMAASTSPIYVATPKGAQVRFSTANAARDGTGTLGTLFTSGANGSFFMGIRFMPEVVIPGGDVVRVFRQALGSGNYELMIELPVPIMNPTSNVPLPCLQPIEWYPPAGVTLAGTDVLKVSTDQGKTYMAEAVGGGDY
jgi:hypothetical protein